MKSIPFTEYVLPNGRKISRIVGCYDDVAQKAFQIIEAGFRFEMEILRTGEVSLTIHDIGKGEDVAIELCLNNQDEFRKAVDRLITEFEPQKV